MIAGACQELQSPARRNFRALKDDRAGRIALNARLAGKIIELGRNKAGEIEGVLKR
jgi:hypothetical protein